MSAEVRRAPLLPHEMQRRESRPRSAVTRTGRRTRQTADGNRVELYASDYLTVDPDFVPIRWSLNDPNRQTLWGHYVPRRWFEEAMSVQSVTDSTFQPTHEPALTSTPTYVH